MAHAINKGHRRGSSLDLDGWALVIGLFNKENDVEVDKIGLKNHYDNSRRFYCGWNELRNMTRVGWNLIAHTFILSSDAWNNFLKRHKHCYRLKLWGYDDESEANLLYSTTNMPQGRIGIIVILVVPLQLKCLRRIMLRKKLRMVGTNLHVLLV